MSCGCTIVQVAGAKGIETRALVPGVTIIDVLPDVANGTSVTTLSYGFQVTQNQLVIGLARDQTVVFPDPEICRIVFVASDEMSVEDAVAVLNSVGLHDRDPCVLGTHEGEDAP